VRAGAVTLDDIISADWSLALDSSTASEASDSRISQVVQGIADINQCIAIVLSTPKGSDPLRPTFVCDLWRWIDAPVTVAPKLVREIVEAITNLEPGVRVLSVVINGPYAERPSQLTVIITFRLTRRGASPGRNSLIT
jgi:phage baseplate assembly protein W